MPTPSCQRIFTRSPRSPPVSNAWRHDGSPPAAEYSCRVRIAPKPLLDLQRQRVQGSPVVAPSVRETAGHPHAGDATRPSRPRRRQSSAVHHEQEPGQRLRVHVGRNHELTPVRQRDLDPRPRVRPGRRRCRGRRRAASAADRTSISGSDARSTMSSDLQLEPQSRQAALTGGIHAWVPRTRRSGSGRSECCADLSHCRSAALWARDPSARNHCRSGNPQDAFVCAERGTVP